MVRAGALRTGGDVEPMLECGLPMETGLKYEYGLILLVTTNRPPVTKGGPS